MHDTTHMEKERVTVTLGKEQIAALRKRLIKEDMSVSQLLRRLIDEYLKAGK